LWTAAVLWAAACVFPMPVAVGLSIAASVWLTGAFHEDGLADTFDALGGTVSRERALAIMKDSRIGTYGAVALLLVLGLKAAALAALPLHQAMAALVLAHCASRAAAVVLIRALPYAGDVAQAKAKPLAQRVSGLSVAVALGWVVLAVVGVGVACAGLQPGAGWGGLAPMAISLLVCAGVTLACARWWAQRLGGITGDTLGATQQLTELGMLLAWLSSGSR